MRQKHDVELQQLWFENATFREWLATQPQPPPPTPLHSPSYHIPTYGETGHNHARTQYSSHNPREETPVHSRFISLTLNNDAVILHLLVNGIMDIPLPIT